MASKRRNMFQKNKTQETTENEDIDWIVVPRLSTRDVNPLANEVNTSAKETGAAVIRGIGCEVIIQETPRGLRQSHSWRIPGYSSKNFGGEGKQLMAIGRGGPLTPRAAALWGVRCGPRRSAATPESVCYRYNTHYSSFKSLDPSSFIFKMSERMDIWNPPESWKRITCIMMIRAGHQNKNIITAAQCSLNILKTIRHELDLQWVYEDLMDKIKTAFAALPRETVASACSRFQSRIEAVIDANGGYFE
ncbi:hypothetical protein AAG570_009309 [Ranatra chinensis]|uniref:Uncharacterized protein n=1 Tax=Ranatra chinensis TaxID=642074 RepID=A0ABD0YNQ5_9HEMI